MSACRGGASGAALLLLVAATALAQGGASFLDQARRLGPRAEWNREIVARNPGSFRCRIESQAPFSVTLLADRAYQALRRSDSAELRREDVLVGMDSGGPTLERDFAVPAAGPYWFILQNQGAAEVEMRLTCRAAAR